MLEFGLKDFVDIFLVAVLLYYMYKLMKDSGSINVFYGIMIFLVLWLVVTHVLEMKLLGSIFDKLVSVGVLALIVIFQEEIRRFLLTLGSHNRARHIVRFFMRQKKMAQSGDDYMPLVMACMKMGYEKVGALIIIEGRMSLSDISSTGEIVDAQLSQMLVENIFFKNSPLHDGAMVISKGRIHSCGCILPVSHSLDIPKELGLRHRAGLGMSQTSDALAIIVSEETGKITVASNGVFRMHLSSEELERAIVEHVNK